MKIALSLSQKPALVSLSIKCSRAGEIWLKGRGDHRGSLYFHKYPLKLDKGMNRVNIPMPITPDRLMVVGGSFKSQTKARLVGVQKSALGASLPTDPETRDYLKLAKYIATYGSLLSSGTYTLGRARINLYPRIVEQGTEEQTPARVIVATGEVDISKKRFCKHSVYVRMYILCHEYGHYVAGSFDELEADYYGAMLYHQAGFPHSEAYYALADILPQGHEADSRLSRMLGIFGSNSPYI